MEALHTTHDELSQLLDQHKQSLRTENGHTAEFCSSFLEMAKILSAFNLSIRTGQWQMHLATSKQMVLPWFFAYDHQNYARYMWLYLGEMSQLPETYPEKCKEFMHVNIMFSPKAILTCLHREGLLLSLILLLFCLIHGSTPKIYESFRIMLPTFFQEGTFCS